MITVEKLRVYDSYEGDVDSLARMGNEHENRLFTSNGDWMLITNFYQDILLINNWLASKAYAENCMVSMRANCDDESYQILLSKLF